MSQETFPPELQAMIDRAGTLTAEEAEKLGQLWESDEDLLLPPPNVFGEAYGALDAPIVTNQDLNNAWDLAVKTAGDANRVDVLDAAIAAGRAVKRDVRHMHDSASSKNGSEEAVRSAVLAVGIRDLLPEKDYGVLVSAWHQVIGLNS
ncbi:MAG TPA: hypothetical protein VGM94_00045 [Galbitalea sp.]|jgi:hypothetical protein